MATEPLSAADSITFLDKIKCPHCDHLGTEASMEEHLYVEHKRRRYRDTTPKKALLGEEMYKALQKAWQNGKMYP